MGYLFHGIIQLADAYGYGVLKAFRNLGLSFALVFPAYAQPVQLVALGDSLTAGYGLAEGEGLVPQLQAWLDGNGVAATVQNAGVSGDTTAGGLARLDWALGPDAQAMMVILGGNDMMRGIDPLEVKRNLTAIMEGAKTRGLPVFLVAMKAPANWGPDYKAAFDAIYPELAEQYDAVFLDDFFTGVIAQGATPSDPASMARWMQGDAIHPNAEGVRVIVTALGPKVAEVIAKVK